MKWLRKLFGIRTPEEDFNAGRQYVINQISQFGMGNKEEMARLWAECDCDFDRSEFDKGMI